MLNLLLLTALVGVPAEALEAGPSPAKMAAPAAAPGSGHEVVQANTLWDLAGRYCKDPWQWPRIHAANRDKIKDPHWIYPGNVIRLDKSGDAPRLSMGGAGGGPGGAGGAGSTGPSGGTEAEAQKGRYQPEQ